MTGNILQVFPIIGHGLGPGTRSYGLAAVTRWWSVIPKPSAAGGTAADVAAESGECAAAAAVDRHLAESVWNRRILFIVLNCQTQYNRRRFFFN